MIDRDALMREIDRLQRKLDEFPSAQTQAAFHELIRLVNRIDAKKVSAVST
jgi:hypothetical protein